MLFGHNDYVKYTYGKGKHLSHRQGRVMKKNVDGSSYSHILTDLGDKLGCCQVLVDDKNVYEIVPQEEVR